MNADTLAAAVRDAKEFLKRAAVFKATEEVHRHSDFTYETYNNAASGALRRQSMELTRSLAALRKP